MEKLIFWAVQKTKWFLHYSYNLTSGHIDYFLKHVTKYSLQYKNFVTDVSNV